MICLFWSVLYCLDYRELYSAQKIFLVFILVCTALYFSHALFFNQQIEAFKYVESLYAFCTIAVYPLFYLYIAQLTGRKQITLKDLWVLLPAVIIGASSLFFYIFMSQTEQNDFVTKVFYHNQSLYADGPWYIKGQMVRIAVMKVVFPLQIIPVGYFGYKHLKAFQMEIEEFYSNVEERSVYKVRAMLITFIIFSLCSIIANHLGRQYFSNQIWLIAIIALLFSILLYAVSYISYKQSFSIETLVNDLTKGDNEIAAEEAEKEEQQEEEDSYTELKRKILEQMEEHKIFRQKDLRLSDLATAISSNRTYVSNLINKEFEMAFSDYINSRRVEYVKELILRNPNPIDWSEVIDKAGFSNEATFYRNFKKFTGSTPEKWHKDKTEEVNSL